MKNTPLYILFLLCALVFPACKADRSSALTKPGGSAADSLDDVEFAQQSEIVEYEDVYLDPEVIIVRRKFWSGYKDLVSELQETSVEIKNDFQSPQNRVSSVFGDKKLVMITPAIWEDTSQFLIQDGDRKSTREYKLFENLGDFFIHSSNKNGITDAPNGTASLSRWVWGYEGIKDVFMDILVAPKFDDPKSVSNWSNDVNDQTNSLYLVLAFPLHKTKSGERLPHQDSLKIQTLQRDIQRYIIKGGDLCFPFGTSLDVLFSTELSKLSSKLSHVSYTQMATFSFSVQSLITQYRAISEDVFSQMSGRISDGFMHSNHPTNFSYYHPGAITQSIAYTLGGSQDLPVQKTKGDVIATKNSVLVVPFLIKKTLTKKGDSSKKGFLLRGNPLAMRVISLDSIAFSTLNYPTGPIQTIPLESVRKINLETQTLASLSNFSKGIASDNVGGATITLGAMGSLFSTPKKKQEDTKKDDKLEVKKDRFGIFDISHSDTSTEIFTKEKISQHIRNNFGDHSQEFSWANLEKLFENDSSRKKLLRAKKPLEKLSDDDFGKFFDWRDGVAKHSLTKDYNVTPILQYAGFDLIFWPEDDLDSISRRFIDVSTP